MTLDDKIIVMTGGSSGIGLDILRLLSPRCSIINLSRSAPVLPTPPSDLVHIATNLEEQASVDSAIAEIRAHYPGGIDGLINCAAVQFTPRLTDSAFDPETIAREAAVNFTHPIRLIAGLLPNLQQASESFILNVNSGLAIVPKAESAVYCATKAGLNNFTRGLRVQLADTHIHVLQAFLPLVETPMTAGRGKDKLRSRDAPDHRGDRTPPERQRHRKGPSASHHPSPVAGARQPHHPKGRWMKPLLKMMLILAAIFASTFLLARTFGLLTEQNIRDWLQMASALSPEIVMAAVITLLLLDLFIAVPTLTVIILGGYFLGFELGLLAAATGSALAGFGGYGLCRRWGEGALRTIVRDAGQRDQMREAFQTHGTGMILLSRAAPILPEVTACMAGALHMPPARFALFWSIGTLPYVAIAAYAGSVSTIENPRPAIYAALGLYALMWTGWLLYRRRWKSSHPC